MLLSRTPAPGQRLRYKVIGYVLILPLAVSLVKLPPALALATAGAAVILGLYGAYLAASQGSRTLAFFAGTTAALNTLSLIALGTASAVIGGYWLAWIGWHALAN
ncbi:hypothetical protein [Pseudomonas sp. Irchel 3F5]|uniref:hypothetical protein n=1 Tax=Pseudomonas sp. Irchel 3F5 TaxID=2009002 RepID=UPI0011401B85|nr:hypothetical protein [Pseudomonas sp. Irchel 3F5]